MLGGRCLDRRELIADGVLVKLERADVIAVLHDDHLGGLSRQDLVFWYMLWLNM